MSTRQELVQLLRDRGVEKVWGRGLTTRTKAELLEFINHTDEQFSGGQVRHLSHSQLTDLQICGLKYYFKRVDPKAPHFPMTGKMQDGRAMHRAFALGYEEKKGNLGGHEANVSAMMDCFVQTFQDPEEDVDWTDCDRAYMEETGVALVNLYHGEIMPEVWPLAVEEKHNVNFVNRPYSMMVIPDLIGMDVPGVPRPPVIVVDHKTGSKTPDANEAEWNDQLTAGALAHSAKEGTLPDRVELHKAIYMRRGPKDAGVYRKLAQTEHGVVGVAVIQATRTQDQINRYLKTLEIAARKMSEGIWEPARQGAWPCTPTACDYWAYCHKEF